MEDSLNSYSNYVMSNINLPNYVGSSGIAQMMQQLGIRPESNINFSPSSDSSVSSNNSNNVNNQRTTNNNLHSQFHSKVVCQLSCKSCDSLLCRRGMKAILLADTKVELYSTDTPPKGVQLVGPDYMTRNCHCCIRDVACLGCGNVVGYHVTQPCPPCLEACNNGHYWMFYTDQVDSCERLDSTGKRILLWAYLPRAEKDVDIRYDMYDLVCR